MTTYGEIWATLSNVNCNDKIEKKGGLSYLSWAWAWGILMKHYPDATYEFADEHYFSDGSCEVICTVTIGECSRRMTLPVMDNRNNSILNPSSRQVSDSRMRCMVKCLAMFGLGHYIYAGEDLPGTDSTITPDQAAVLKSKIEKFGVDPAKFCNAFAIESMDQLPAAQFNRAIAMLDKRGGGK